MFGDLEDLGASLLHFTSQFKRAMAEEVSCQEDLSHTNQTIELAKAAGSKGWRYLELWPAVKRIWWRIGRRRWTPSLILYRE
ncbi:unnamed protein product [Boreogadus saida]